MSRVGGDYEEDFQNQGLLWHQSMLNALNGRRGQAALADLREALLHLPRKRLIARALCTVNPEARMPEANSFWDPTADFRDLVEEQGEGVCAVGAYIWWQKVKAGADPERAFAEIPTGDDTDSDIWETVHAGRQAGLAYTLAWQLAYMNDDRWEGYSPEERYSAFMEWLDRHIKQHPWQVVSDI